MPFQPGEQAQSFRIGSQTPLLQSESASHFDSQFVDGFQTQLQSQVSGATQVPPLAHGLEQTAEKRRHSQWNWSIRFKVD